MTYVHNLESGPHHCADYYSVITQKECSLPTLKQHMPLQGRGTGEVGRAPDRLGSQVYKLVEVIEQRYRALVLLGTFASLR